MEKYSCYGNFDGSAKRCRCCEYGGSCDFYTADIKRDTRDRHLVSLDENFYHIAENTAAPDGKTDKKAGANGTFAAAIARFFRYMLELDDYTVGIISEIIAPRNKGERHDVGTLAKLRGCTRQALHRKILDEIASRPELGALFMGLFSKLQRSRRTFMRRRGMQPSAVI